MQYDCGEQLPSSYNRIPTCEVDTSRCSNRSFVLNTQTKEEINPFSVRRMFERDFSEGSIPGSGFSKEDRRFLAIAREGITQLVNGHCELPLPLKKPNIVIPNYRDLAFRRLLQLKRRFLADERYRHDYITFIEGMEGMICRKGEIKCLFVVGCGTTKRLVYPTPRGIPSEEAN